MYCGSGEGNIYEEVIAAKFNISDRLERTV